MAENSVELEKEKNIYQIFSPISFHGRKIYDVTSHLRKCVVHHNGFWDSTRVRLHLNPLKSPKIWKLRTGSSYFVCQLADSVRVIARTSTKETGLVRTRNSSQLTKWKSCPRHRPCPDPLVSSDCSSWSTWMSAAVKINRKKNSNKVNNSRNQMKKYTTMTSHCIYICICLLSINQSFKMTGWKK